MTAKSENKKQLLAVRYDDADVVAAFIATGKGWQTRMNAARLAKNALAAR